jgi:hypothetical protein
MQCLQRLVGDGYRWYTGGVVPVTRLRTLVRKFEDLYLVSLDHNRRHRRRQLGLGNARLVLWQERYPTGNVAFMLVVTDGDHPARALEPLKDAVAGHSRMSVTGYELVRHQRADTSHPSWTWRMTTETYEYWRNRIRQSIRHRNYLAIARDWQSLHAVPGFGGCRSQVRALVRLVRAELKRTPVPDLTLPTRRHRYVQLVSLRGKSIAEVERAAEAASTVATDQHLEVIQDEDPARGFSSVETLSA